MIHYFSGEKYNSMSHGITSVFSHENQEWKTVAAAEFEISDYINKEKLSELIFGPIWGQFISSFLQILSYCSGVSFLIVLLRKMLKANTDCFQRPIQIRFEKPNVNGDEKIYHSGQSVVQIDDEENAYQTQGLNFEGTQIIIHFKLRVKMMMIFHPHISWGAKAPIELAIEIHSLIE